MAGCPSRRALWPDTACGGRWRVFFTGNTYLKTCGIGSIGLHVNKCKKQGQGSSEESGGERQRAHEDNSELDEDAEGKERPKYCLCDSLDMITYYRLQNNKTQSSRRSVTGIVVIHLPLSHLHRSEFYITLHSCFSPSLCFCTLNSPMCSWL